MSPEFQPDDGADAASLAPGRRTPFVRVVAATLIGMIVVAAIGFVVFRVFVPEHAVEQSENWAGYVATGRTYGSVTATWVVPAVPAGRRDAAAAVWAGLDGYPGTHLEQIGTVSASVGGRPAYDAWYEILPRGAVYLSLVIRPGDRVRAVVTAVGSGRFVLSLTDLSTGRSFTTRQSHSGSSRSSAELVVEAPTFSRLLPLADFGRVRFTDVSVDGRGLGHYAWRRVEMRGTGRAGATASELSADGRSFTVDWLAR